MTKVVKGGGGGGGIGKLSLYGSAICQENMIWISLYVVADFCYCCIFTIINLTYIDIDILNNDDIFWYKNDDTLQYE
jgi:hypothetical protein